MRRTALLLLAACSNAPEQAFVVDGFVDEPTHPRASVIGLWELATDPPRYYKLGDGVRSGTRFTLGFDTDPPPGALDADGIGVAYVVMLPEFTTVPDGLVDPDTLGIVGISGGTGVVYKTAMASGPAWAAPLAPRFSCVQCIRNPGGLDRFEQIACASVLVEGPAEPLCNWY